MARRFQNGHAIIWPVPGALNGSDGGPLTILVVAKVNTSAYQAPIYTRSSGAHGWWLEYDTAGGLHVNFGTGTTPRNTGTVATGAWVITTGRKDAGGSVHPFGRNLTGAGFTTDSGDIDSGATLIDGTAIDTSYGIQTGRWGNTGSDYSGDLEIAFIAVWTSLVAGATLAALTTEALILAASPTYWISYEGTGTVDSAGATPAVTGTTTTTDPDGFFGGGPEPVDAVLAATLPGPTAALTAHTSIAATASATLPAPVGALTATTEVPATLTATLPAPVAALSAQTAVNAALSATLPAPSASMVATTPGAVSATLAALLPAPVAALTASTRVAATLSALLPAPAARIVIPTGLERDLEVQMLTPWLAWTVGEPLTSWQAYVLETAWSAGKIEVR